MSKLNTRHIGIFTTAQDFWESANKLNDGLHWMGISMSVYYLFFHGIELALKSFIYYKNKDEKELRSIGHNLQKAWKIAEKLGIKSICSETEELQMCIDRVSLMYEGKELEYYYPGLKRFPVVGDVSSACNNLNTALHHYYRNEYKNQLERK